MSEKLSEPLTILNEFEAKSLRASFPAEASADFIFEISQRIWSINSPEERLVSFYYLNKIAFDKYGSIKQSDFVSRLEEISDDLLWNFKNCIDYFELNVYKNKLFLKFCNLLKNDSQFMSRLFMTSIIEDEIETLGFHTYLLTENKFLKDRLKKDIIKLICYESEMSLIDLSSCSDIFKEALFEEALSQFVVDYNPIGF